MEAQSSAFSSDYDPNILLLLNDLENPNETLVSDSQFAEELQLQEAIVASFTTLQNPQNISAQPQKPSMELGSFTTLQNPQNISAQPQKASMELGESSQNSCEICEERKENNKMFPLQDCIHKFCTECISKHISIKIKKRSSPVLTCPVLECESKLTIENCKQILDEDVLMTWDDVLCESLIPESQKVYCPYKDCSGLLINDGDGEVIREAECPYCNRMFCAECNVAWHFGFNCEEFSRLGEDEKGSEDLMVHQLAKENKWPRCPKCRFIVERNEGCLHMTCRCGFQFCYACGKAWSSTHGGCR